MFKKLLHRTKKAYSNASPDVWLSRNIKDQQLQHWMLVVKNHKLELVRMSSGDYQLAYEYEDGWTADIERVKPVASTRGRRGNGYDGWAMSRIGWTQAADLVIDDYIQQVRMRFGPPKRFLWTDCQNLLREVADMIVHDRDPHYWGFFVDNTDARRQNVSQLPGPEALQAGMHANANRNTRPNVQLWDAY
ncbi:hypothetical protein Slin14017_G109760 [Septoria linicola]|nr:hypothetical protein Slin14017_G109760 [Septoria linicola]